MIEEAEEEEEEVVEEVDTVIEMDIKEIIIEVVIQIMNMINKKEEKNKMVTTKFIMTMILTNDPYKTNILRKCSLFQLLFMIYNICNIKKFIQIVNEYNTTTM